MSQKKLINKMSRLPPPDNQPKLNSNSNYHPKGVVGGPAIPMPHYKPKVKSRRMLNDDTVYIKTIRS